MAEKTLWCVFWILFAWQAWKHRPERRIITITDKRQGVDRSHPYDAGLAASPQYAVRVSGEGWKACSCRAWHKMERGRMYRVFSQGDFIFSAKPFI